MTEPSYEYRGLMASTWDFFREDHTFEDRDFYREIINKSGQPVLDVGCGTGRLLLDYLKDGVDVDGVDNSPEMLAICREKAARAGLNPTLFEQWMEALDLPRAYRTVIVPSSSFQLVTDGDLASQAMKRFIDHLEPGGILVMSFFSPVFTDDDDTDSNEWHLLSEKTNPEDYSIVRHWIRGQWDTSTQLQHTENRYAIERNGEIVASETIYQSPALRWYTQHQATVLYSQAGFENIQIYKAFTFVAASEADNTFVIVAEKPVH
jgi:ubiquinone/menaquinone biosynthesis C-methylase UbiE